MVTWGIWSRFLEVDLLVDHQLEVHEPDAVLRVVHDLLVVGSALYRDHHALLGVVELGEDDGAEVALLVEVGVEAGGESRAGEVGDGPQVLPVPRVLAVALQPYPVNGKVGC